MLINILSIKNKASLSMWLKPILITILFTVFFYSMSVLDIRYFSTDYKYINLPFDKNSARTVLGVIASSLITVVGVVFSITILTLSMAANLLGPRLLPNFIRAGQSQTVLGFFLGTFVFCILTLSIFDSNQEFILLTYLSVSFGILCFILLIYFIHFICQFIQIENILFGISYDLKKVIKRLLVPKDQTIILKTNNDFKHLCHTLNKLEIYNKKSGYIQSIDYNSLLTKARKKDLIIDIKVRPGEYILTNTPVITIYTNQKIPKNNYNDLLSELKIGKIRSQIQDIEFCFELMVEIAVRALSSGINNPYTAMLCINHIANNIIYLNNYKQPCNILLDNEKNIRLRYDFYTFESIINKAFDRLRQQAKFDVSVSIKLLQVFKSMVATKLHPKILGCIKSQAELVYQTSLMQIDNESDKIDLKHSFEAINFN